jgi:hypothetical protein
MKMKYLFLFKAAVAVERERVVYKKKSFFFNLRINEIRLRARFFLTYIIKIMSN